MEGARQSGDERKRLKSITDEAAIDESRIVDIVRVQVGDEVWEEDLVADGKAEVLRNAAAEVLDDRVGRLWEMLGQIREAEVCGA